MPSDPLGYRLLSVDEAPYAPCVDLLCNGRRLATLYWDDEPTFGFDVDAHGRPDEDRPVIGAPDEAVGWVWFFSDQPIEQTVITTDPAQSLEVALAIVQEDVERRLARETWIERALPWGRLP